MHNLHGFEARALDEGGLIHESSDCKPFAGAMQRLDKQLGEWFREHDRYPAGHGTWVS